MGKVTWTKGQEDYLEQLYSEYIPLNEIVEKINSHFGVSKTSAAVSSKAVKLGLTKKYIKPNNQKFKAIYQDYDWYYEQFVEKGLDHEEMAALANCTKRVIEKWGKEKHHIDTHTRIKNKRLNSLQHSLMIGSLLGDGHIDRREKYPLFIVSHAENQKDYLFYKYDLLQDLCEMFPTYYQERERVVDGVVYKCQPYWRFNTRVYDCLRVYRDMSKIDLIKALDEYAFSIWMLDDGHCCKKGYWQLCIPLSNNKEREEMVSVLFDKFEISAVQASDSRYFKFNAKDSTKITDMIINNIPNNLDIVKYKIFSKKKYALVGGR